jgi:glycosyltransferase involved in cell wall biosynthesis
MKLVVNARFLTQKLTGVQRYALELSIQIKHMVKGVIFVAPDAILHEEAARVLDVKIVGKEKGHLWEQTDLYRFLKKNGNPPLLNLANTAPLRYRNNYLTIHDLAFIHHPEWNTQLFAAWYRFLIPRLAKRARHLFTVSETIRHEIQQTLKIPQQKISVTYNGIASVFQNVGQGVTRREQILAVGAFSPRKNHDKLVTAFLASGLARTHRLVIVGDKDEIFRETGLAIEHAAISLIDRPDDQALTRLYQESETLVCLSAYEGFGLPVLEGLYFGCKVLCSDIAVFQELFGEYVYFCDPTKIEEISAALIAVSTASQEDKAPPPALFERYSYSAAASVIHNAIFG